MNPTPYHQFIDLVRCDDQIIACMRTLENFKKDLAVLEQEKVSNHLTFEQIQNNVRSMKKELDAKDLELSATRQKKNTLEKKLTIVSSTREYQSLQHEQAALDTAIEMIETAIMHAWEPYEKEKSGLISHEQEYLKKAADLITQEKKIQEQYDALQETIGFLTRDRQNKVALVRQDWLTTYESLKQSVNNPVVEMKLGACSGCFNQVTSQIQMRIRHHELVSCPMCRRILYEL